jgi:beta-N-acetylhexosaminidase
LVIGLPGAALTAEDEAHLRALRPAGVILFARNCTVPDQLRTLTEQVRATLGYAPLVMIDHEGGRIIRFATGVTRFPAALEAGRAQDAQAVYVQGRLEAQELSALGINVNLAPCLDVLIEGADPVIGDRSYGTDPQRVAELGAARIRGLQEHGVLACAKHFPGIGALTRDPHQTLSGIDISLEQLRARELRPFQAAIASGVALVMSSHIVYTQWDAQRVPATFSAFLMRRLLRDELGFGGLTITDDLEMGAIQHLCSIEEAAVRAVEAGHDLLLICHERETQRRAWQALLAAYGTGRLTRQYCDESMRRLRRLSAARVPA